MRIVITGGPAREPIDQVRSITNQSTGELAVKLARGFLAAGHDVESFQGRGARWFPDHAKCFQTNEELLQMLGEIADREQVAGVLHAAALSDFGVAQATIAGKPSKALKISSDAESGILTGLSPYIFGTTRLGDNRIGFEDRVNIARYAMHSGIWFHTSHTYDNALEVLRAAFDQDRNHVPKLIVKLIGNTIGELRDVLRKNLDPLGVDRIELGQLCLGGALAVDFAGGGECYTEFSKLRSEGRVLRFVLEVFPWTSDVAIKALQGGYTKGIVDGLILYLNPLQRFASNALWDSIRSRNEPVIALRTVAGGNVHRLRDVPGAAWKDYLQKRAVQVAPIFERSGIKSWTEFCVRYAHSFPQVRATVGATSRAQNLAEFLAAARPPIQPLPLDLIESINELQYRWSDEVDRLAEPWSM